MWLTRFSIQRPIIVSMLFIALAVFGVISYSKLGRSLNPNVTFPVVVVSAGYPGASPEEMERLVVKPIEDQLDGINNLDQMTATAQEGRAAVVVQFKLDTNLDFAAIDVQRRVDTARVYMPTDLDPPSVDKSAGSQQAPILELALSSTSISRAALSDLVDQRILPELKHIPDVESVDERGQVQREYHVTPDPLRLLATGATLPDVFSALAANNANLPGGRLDSPTQEMDVSIRSDIVRADDMLGIPLAPAGGALRELTIGNVGDGRGRPHREARRLEVPRQPDDPDRPQPGHHRRRDPLDRGGARASHRDRQEVSRRSSSTRSRSRPSIRRLR